MFLNVLLLCYYLLGLQIVDSFVFIEHKLNHKTKAYGKFWDRLEIDDNSEIRWYLLNCQVGNELGLLRQVGIVLADFPKEDVKRWSVPTKRLARSHGKRNVIDEIVLYQGYVFVKMRFCDVYEAIQTCPLLRSFMGTIRLKGYRKLPSIPLPLTEDEVSNFVGLEDQLKNETETMTKEDLLRAYDGFEVGQMVKILEGIHKGEDGTIRRFKNNKMLIRLFTYGSTYDEWILPENLRKLSNLEILKGLSGPSKPINNYDFQNQINPKPQKDRKGHSNLFSQTFAPGRNRRQDRVSRGDGFYKSLKNEQLQQEDENWAKYKYEQKQRIQKDKSARKEKDDFTVLNEIMAELSDDSSDHSSSTNPISSTNNQDDLFDSLLAELTSDDEKEFASTPEDDFFATLEKEMTATTPSNPTTSNQYDSFDDNNDDFIYKDKKKSFKVKHRDGPTPRDVFKAKDNIAPSRNDDAFFSGLDFDELYQQDQNEDVNKVDTIDNDSQNLSKLKVPELKQLLRQKSLKVSGKKSELIDRLIQSS